jgi:hypothetical protein
MLVTFRNFGSLYMLLFGYLNSRSPEPRNPDGRVPLSFFTFRELWCVDPEPRNPDTLDTFRKFVYIVVWVLELTKSRTPKPRWAGPTFLFHLSTSNMKSRTPKPQSTTVFPLSRIFGKRRGPFVSFLCSALIIAETRLTSVMFHKL